RRMHAEAGNGFDNIIGFLAVGEHPENRAHETDILDIGAQKHQMAHDAEEFAHHDAGNLDPFRYLDAKHLFQVHDIGQLVHDAAEVIDTIRIGNIGVP